MGIVTPCAISFFQKKPSKNNKIANYFKMLKQVNTCGLIRRSIQRRTNGGREYLTFAQQYVGAKVGPGLRALQV